jgi:hypothetical protein
MDIVLLRLRWFYASISIHFVPLGSIVLFQRVLKTIKFRLQDMNMVNAHTSYDLILSVFEIMIDLRDKINKVCNSIIPLLREDLVAWIRLEFCVNEARHSMLTLEGKSRKKKSEIDPCASPLSSCNWIQRQEIIVGVFPFCDFSM